MAGYKTIFTVWLEVHLIKTENKERKHLHGGRGRHERNEPPQSDGGLGRFPAVFPKFSAMCFSCFHNEKK